jgi:Novel STAND NTPase 3
MTGSSSYRLDELGWLQFDRLCSLVLEADAGLGGLQWRGRGDIARVARVDGPLVLRDRGHRLGGPVTVAAVWIRGMERRLSEFAERVVSLPAERAEWLLVMTNLDTADAQDALRADALGQDLRVVILGAAEISGSLDRDPRLRAAMPSVLGLRDLDELIESDVRARSSLDAGRAQELARVFWPTRAYDRARDVLGRHRFVVLSGPPEMGKTAIAEMLALASMTDGWEVHECNDPDQVWRVFDRDRRQVFIADDAFGSTEYRPDAAERWARGLGRLLEMLDSQHWLIWTSRPAPLKAGLRRVQRESGSERFPAPAEVLVDASDLDLADKTLILFRHTKDHGAAGTARKLVRSAGLSIVEHPHFTPERIRRFVTDRLDELQGLVADDQRRMLRMIDEELASPTEAMRTSFRALESEHRELLISLLDAPAGLIDERELAAVVRRHHAGGLSRPVCELIDRLTDHFLGVTPLGIGWVHPSWRDLVIDELREDPNARLRFLSVSGIDGVTLAVSAAGGSTGERTLPLLLDDADWDALGDRLHELRPELEDRELARVLLALSGAIAVVNDPYEARELDSLAANVLRTTRRAWDEQRAPVAVFLLEAWYGANACLARPVAHPHLAPTWAELHPGALLLEHPDPAELARTEEWLEFAEVLRRYDLSALEWFGFFTKDRDLLKRLIVTLSHTSADEDLRPLTESVLARIERLVPGLAAGAQSAREIGRLVEGLGRRRWWVPEDIAAPPSNEPAIAGATDFHREDVDRVLRDL